MSDSLPLLLRAARGESVERPPVWMMRQAGRYMKVYRDLRDRHPSFRERSENPDLSYEISMQPFEAFQPDGVILFSDILTPLPGMGIDFDIVESKGPLINDPIRNLSQVDALKPLIPSESMPFVGEVLGRLRESVGNQAAVLGFVGAPWTLAAYVVEGKSSKNYAVIKAMAFQEPACSTDCWTTSLSRSPATSATRLIPVPRWCRCSIPGPVGSARRLRHVRRAVSEEGCGSGQADPPRHTLHPLHLGQCRVIERMATTGVDIISLDWTVDMAEALARLPEHIGVQGNVDPGLLFGTPEAIQARIDDCVSKARGRRHILNLGHGILPGTPEENGRAFFEAGKSVMERIGAAA